MSSEETILSVLFTELVFSLGVGVFASLLVLIIGIIYGSVSGFCGGKVDMVMMRIVDIIYSLPDMLLIIFTRSCIK